MVHTSRPWVRPCDLAGVIRSALAERASPDRAAQQQAYMRSALPYRGLRLPDVRIVVARCLTWGRLPDASSWETAIRLLWDEAAFREEWYAALAVARAKEYRDWSRDCAVLPLYEHLIRTGAWWDVCDEIAQHLVGPLYEADASVLGEHMRAWAHDAHPWIRRCSILSQNGRRAHTDSALLAHCIAPSLGDSDFFQRKAIGWALREYSKTAPDWVVGYVRDHRAELSPLSVREALRLLPLRLVS